MITSPDKLQACFQAAQIDLNLIRSAQIDLNDLVRFQAVRDFSRNFSSQPWLSLPPDPGIDVTVGKVGNKVGQSI